MATGVTDLSKVQKESAGDGDDDSWLYGENSQASGKRPSLSEADAETTQDSEITQKQTSTVTSHLELNTDDNATDGQNLPAEDKEEDAADGAGDVAVTGRDAADGAGDQTAPDLESGQIEDDDSDEEDDIVVKIGDIKTGGSLEPRRFLGPGPGGARPRPAVTVKAATTKGIDVTAEGEIDGVPTYDYDIESINIDERPWRKPGADITDYFNYGFNEESWKVYCQRQQSLRGQQAQGTYIAHGINTLGSSYDSNIMGQQQQQQQSVQGTFIKIGGPQSSVQVKATQPAVVIRSMAPPTSSVIVRPQQAGPQPVVTSGISVVDSRRADEENDEWDMSEYPEADLAPPYIPPQPVYAPPPAQFGMMPGGPPPHHMMHMHRPPPPHMRPPGFGGPPGYPGVPPPNFGPGYGPPPQAFNPGFRPRGPPPMRPTGPPPADWTPDRPKDDDADSPPRHPESPALPDEQTSRDENWRRSRSRSRDRSERERGSSRRTDGERDRERDRDRRHREERREERRDREDRREDRRDRDREDRPKKRRHRDEDDEYSGSSRRERSPRDRGEKSPRDRESRHKKSKRSRRDVDEADEDSTSRQ